MIENTDRVVPTWYKQSIFKEFRTLYAEERDFPVLFIGSGLSVGAGLPAWRDLLIKLAEAHDEIWRDHPIMNEVIATLESPETSQTRYHDAGSIIAQAFEMDGPPRGMWKALTRLLTPQNSRSPVHDAIARLKWRRIITTNYDVLLERSAEESDLHRGVQVASPPVDEFMESMKVDNADYILKIHGNISEPRSHLVLSKESFDQLYDPPSDTFKRTDEENRYESDDKRDLSRDYRQVMGNILNAASVILFLGYSHDDQYVRKLFEDELYQKFRRKIFAIVPREGRGTEFDARLRELSEEVKVKFITYSPDNHHQELLEFIDYFGQTEMADAEGKRSISYNSQDYDRLYRELATIHRPTVVMLHCGGTIGSEPEPDSESSTQQLEVVVKTSRYDRGLHKFSKQLLDRYQTSYNTGDAFQPEIVWEILPPAQQMFSENATPHLWNALQDKIAKIIYKYFQAPVVHEAGSYSTEPLLGAIYDEEFDQYAAVYGEHDGGLTERKFRFDFTNRYIMGIVVLFGTDTLAFAAGALSLSLQHLPCPVVITGANQSPREESIAAARGQFRARSDTWLNLMSSLYFLQCFGHRLTEAFVCFGGTVHNAVNLRKRMTEGDVEADAEIIPRYREPFAFRNLSPRGQYMFKIIDGLFCNNYYPNPYSYAELVGEHETFVDLRHIRFDALAEVPRRTTEAESFSDGVAYFEVSPCFPPTSVRELIEHGIAVCLVQGFPSGTFPSRPENHFSRFLLDAYSVGLPIVLISRYGILASQRTYGLADEVEGHVPMLHLYEIIVETALPLLSMVVHTAVQNAEWDTKGTADAVIRARLRILREGVESTFRDRPNIISLEFEHVANKTKMYDGLVKLQKEKAALREKRWNDSYPRWTRFPSADDVRELISERDMTYPDGFVVLARNDGLAILDELPRVFENANAGPDGMEVLFDAGFEIGLALWDTFRNKLATAQRMTSDGDEDHGLDFFFEQDTRRREKRVGTAYDVLSRVCGLVDLAGFAQNTQPDLRIGSQPEQTARDESAGSLVLSINVKRHQSVGQLDERYAAMGFSDDEREFFALLKSGCERGGEPDRHNRELQKLYEKLLRTTWMYATGTIDWMLLGIFKGVACRIATFLRIDHYASPAGATEDVRKRMKNHINYVDDAELQISYQYFELGAPRRNTSWTT